MADLEMLWVCPRCRWVLPVLHEPESPPCPNEECGHPTMVLVAGTEEDLEAALVPTMERRFEDLNRAGREFGRVVIEQLEGLRRLFPRRR